MVLFIRVMVGIKEEDGNWIFVIRDWVVIGIYMVLLSILL